MRPLCTSPKRLGEVIAHPVISFPARVTLSSCGRWRWGGFPPGTEQHQLGGGDDAGKINLSSFSFCAVSLMFFVSLCCCSFSSRPQSYARAVFSHR